MRVNECRHGFTVTNTVNCEDVGGTLITMRHDATGARLLWMKNGEENKLFSIAFKTVPWDDTGVFHILEHSVLCGSKRYPVKEPFLELLKSSMNTFLNALTFPDKTMYPVSSRNGADFMNLVRVYLDAVFQPAIYFNPCIFQQEGWHIEQREPGGEKSYKGVVFNEMKGALSSVHRRMAEELNRMLYPDSPYRFLSGGDPAVIPQLTYERFLEAHREFYHPSNAYIYLDGSIDIDSVLALLEEVFSGYERSDAVHALPVQAPIAPCRREIAYELATGQPKDMQTHAMSAKLLGSWKEREKLMAMEIIASAIAEQNESPLKRALLDTGLCCDVLLTLDSGTLQARGITAFMNTEPEHVDALLDTTREVADRLSREGIDRGDLSAAIDRMEFELREVEEPAALSRNINVLSSWLYGGDPLLYLRFDEAFAFLRAQLETDYYERLLREWLVDDAGAALVVARPDEKYGEREAGTEAERLEAQAAQMDEGELLELNRKLDAWQQTPDSPEQLATIPRLPLSEVNVEPVRVSTEEDALDGVTLLRHPCRQKGIVSLMMYFAVPDLTGEQITELSLLADLLGELPTSDRPLSELQRLTKANFGSLTYDVSSFSERDKPGVTKPFFVVRAKFLERHLDDVLPLLAEILTNTRFDCPELLREQLTQMDEGGKQEIITAGHAYAIMRASASLSARSTLQELRGGFTSWKRVHELATAPEEEISALMERLETLRAKTFARARLTMSVTAQGRSDVSALLPLLPEGEAPARDVFSEILALPKAQAIRIPAPISYSACAMQAGAHGVWNVAASILSLEYLWTEVRVKGGAYGAGASVGGTGELIYYSYRDPTPYASIGFDRSAADFLRAYAVEAPGLDSYIISTIAKAEPLLSDSALGVLADGWWFIGRTWEMRCEDRRRVLGTTKESLLAICDQLEAPLNWCITGPQSAIDAAGEEEPVIESL